MRPPPAGANATLPSNPPTDAGTTVAPLPPYVSVPQTARRQHDVNGLSPGAHAVIRDHGLDTANVAKWAAHYALRDGVDFNKAPELDFQNAPLGRNLYEHARRSVAFAPFLSKFTRALGSLDYATADSVIMECLVNGTITDGGGVNVYPEWRMHTDSTWKCEVIGSRGRRAGARPAQV